MRRLRVLVVLAVAVAAVPAADAAAPRYAPLPSPLAPLSVSPPLSGGATSSSESIRHRVSAATVVRASVDGTGAPFALTATQRLDVDVKGDYFFTIGAPALDVRTAPGSESAPGLRSASILWAGFDPGHRRLAATVVLAPAVAAAALPLRIHAGARRTTLVNATATVVGGFAADAKTAALRRALAQLESDVAHGRPPSSIGATIVSPARATTYRTFATLHVSGTIGPRRVDLLLGTAPRTLSVHGPIHLTVEPVPPLALLRSAPTLSGPALLHRATLALLGVARARQYDTYLGNPDPAGRNETTYVYRSARRPQPVAVTRIPPAPGRDWARTLGVAVAVLAAGGLGLAVWARS